MDESELPRRLSKLWEIEPIERGKAIKLINKILSKILSNPTSAKYGDLNFHKIRSKFQKCGPAFYLLYEAGFKQSMNGQRLQWTFNNENFILLKNAYNALQNKINTPEIITKPSPLKTTSESNEWLGTKYRRKIQARMKKLENEKTQKRNLIKEKIAMKKKEQKIEQKRSLEKVKIEKEKQAEAATIFMKEQFANTMNNIMNQMMKNMSPNSNSNSDQISENKYDENVVNNLIQLEMGTKEQCIKASRMADDYKDIESVVEALQVVLSGDVIEDNKGDNGQEIQDENIEMNVDNKGDNVNEDNKGDNDNVDEIENINIDKGNDDVENIVDNGNDDDENVTVITLRKKGSDMIEKSNDVEGMDEMNVDNDVGGNKDDNGNVSVIVLKKRNKD